MNPFVLTSFIIPASVAFVLITLLIKERYNLLPKKTNTNVGTNFNIEEEQNQANYKRDRFKQGKIYPDDFLDFSGGTMGI
ncbi:MAG TPA: hypothetical protein VKG26_04960 [Bacteroidia bacterium]|nr:hypothetical protein [Bacteroidia bacterium]